MLTVHEVRKSVKVRARTSCFYVSIDYYMYLQGTALGYLLFIGDANLFPKFASVSFLVSPPGKYLEHIRD